MKEKYSGKRVNKAGEKFLTNAIFDEPDDFNSAMDILSYWRFQHETPLETAISLLEEESKKHDKAAIFAKRLKRYPSIVVKLRRFPKMKLKNMQDIGGCRAIVSSKKKLYQIIRELRKRDEFRNNENALRFKDYIKSPKVDGYRGYHLVGTFKDQNRNNKLIELQLRTTIQHDWATALEIVDLFTGQALKSNKGEENWREFFRLVSQHFSLMEEIHLFAQKSQDEQFIQYQKKLISNNKYFHTGAKIFSYEANLKVMKNLEAFAHSLMVADEHVSEQQVSGYVLLKVDTQNTNVSSTIFSDSQNDEAEKMYLEFEKEASGASDIVVALVSTTALGGIKEAYPNYFADSTEFIKYLTYILMAQKYRKPSFMQRILRNSGL